MNSQYVEWMKRYRPGRVEFWLQSLVVCGVFESVGGCSVFRIWRRMSRHRCSECSSNPHISVRPWALKYSDFRLRARIQWWIEMSFVLSIYRFVDHTLGSKDWPVASIEASKLVSQDSPWNSWAWIGCQLKYWRRTLCIGRINRYVWFDRSRCQMPFLRQALEILGNRNNPYNLTAMKRAESFWWTYRGQSLFRILLQSVGRILDQRWAFWLARRSDSTW